MLFLSEASPLPLSLYPTSANTVYLYQMVSFHCLRFSVDSMLLQYPRSTIICTYLSSLISLNPCLNSIHTDDLSVVVFQRYHTFSPLPFVHLTTVWNNSSQLLYQVKSCSALSLDFTSCRKPSLNAQVWIRCYSCEFSPYHLLT